MKRITQLAKELNTPVASILDILKVLDMQASSAHAKLDEASIALVIEKLKAKATNTPATRTVIKSVADLSTTNIPAEFERPNMFENEQLALIAPQEPFKDRQAVIRKFEAVEVETIFSDFEAFSICAGMEDRTARKMARRYFAEEDITEENLHYAHDAAMQVLKQKGPQLMSYLISLPPLPFQALNATQIFSEFDKRKKSSRFPILRITYYNDAQKREKIHIGFFGTPSPDGRVRHDNVLEVKNKSTGETLMKIARDGRVLPQAGAKQILPGILLFIRFSQNVKDFIVNYGLETGECSICGRELTDPVSIKLGIGPVCRSL
jgi:hypothetical protein